MIVDNSQKKERRIEIFLTGRTWHFNLTGTNSHTQGC